MDIKISKFSAYSKNLKQNLESLFTELNQRDFITSKQMYNDALKLFHIEIRQVQKGNLVFVTDGNGHPIRHPIKMSDFEERPQFYQSKGKAERIELADKGLVDKSSNPIINNTSSRMLVDLLRLIPYYSYVLMKVTLEIRKIRIEYGYEKLSGAYFFLIGWNNS